MKTQMVIIRQLRIIGIIEGLSYLVLLFISMPLKYLYKIPQAVVINGWIHGFLFVMLAACIIRAWVARKWKFKRAFQAGLASLLPFGTFVFDKTLREEEKFIIRQSDNSTIGQ